MLKDGFARRTFRGLELEGYFFLQLPGSEHASISVLDDGRSLLINGNFDPSGKRNPGQAWGYPPPHTRMSIKEWSSHCRKAMEVLERWGGISKFSKLPFVDHYYSPSGKEVSVEEALDW